MARTTGTGSSRYDSILAIRMPAAMQISSGSGLPASRFRLSRISSITAGIVNGLTASTMISVWRATCALFFATLIFKVFFRFSTCSVWGSLTRIRVGSAACARTRPLHRAPPIAPAPIMPIRFSVSIDFSHWGRGPPSVSVVRAARGAGRRRALIDIHDNIGGHEHIDALADALDRSVQRIADAVQEIDDPFRHLRRGFFEVDDLLFAALEAIGSDLRILERPVRSGAQRPGPLGPSAGAEAAPVCCEAGGGTPGWVSSSSGSSTPTIMSLQRVQKDRRGYSSSDIGCAFTVAFPPHIRGCEFLTRDVIVSRFRILMRERSKGGSEPR